MSERHWSQHPLQMIAQSQGTGERTNTVATQGETQPSHDELARVLRDVADQLEYGEVVTFDVHAFVEAL